MRLAQINKKLARVDRELDKSIEKTEIPGAVVLASMPREGHLVEHSSIRGLAAMNPERVPMSRDTIFDLASLTKCMATTTAILLLVKDGVLSLDDAAEKHLPHFGQREKEAVTLRHLLTHSSGLKPWVPFYEMAREKELKKGEVIIRSADAREFVLDRICRSKLVHEPGAAAVYGDLDFIILGAVIEEVTGQSLDQYCTEKIFKPFGMENTFFVPLPVGGGRPEGIVRQRFAATENCPWREEIIWGEVHDSNSWMMGGVSGHAGLFGSAPDVMRFAQVLVDVWHDRSDLLPRELLQSFCTRQKMPENSDWALGWDTPTAGASSSGQYFSENSIGHLGFTGTSVWIDLEREAIVTLLSNRVHQVAKRSYFGLRPKVHDLIMEAFLLDL
jgi:CubicO group peptidase (beta-lactamase class C family)